MFFPSFLNLFQKTKASLSKPVSNVLMSLIASFELLKQVSATKKHGFSWLCKHTVLLTHEGSVLVMSVLGANRWCFSVLKRFSKSFIR